MTVFCKRSEQVSSAGQWLQRLEQRWHSQDVDYSFQIVAHDTESQFRFCFFQSAQQEPGIAHQPFHRSVWVLDHFPALFHPDRITRGALVHRFPGVLVKVAHNLPLGRSRTLWLQGTAATRRAPVFLFLFCVRDLAAGQRFTGRALPSVAGGIVGEPVAAEVLLAFLLTVSARGTIAVMPSFWQRWPCSPFE